MKVKNISKLIEIISELTLRGYLLFLLYSFNVVSFNIVVTLSFVSLLSDYIGTYADRKRDKEVTEEFERMLSIKE